MKPPSFRANPLPNDGCLLHLDRRAREVLGTLAAAAVAAIEGEPALIPADLDTHFLGALASKLKLNPTVGPGRN